MASTYVNDLRLEEVGTGDQSGSWGTTTNTNLELISEAFSYGAEAVANASTHTITVADGASDEARSFYMKCTGGGQACTVTLAPSTLSKVWMIENATSYTLTFSQGSGANVAIAAGQVKMIATDGGGSGAIIYDLLTDVNLAGTTTAATLTVAGTLGTGGAITSGAGLVIADAGNIGSASDTDAISIASNGAIVMSGASVTVSGALGVSGAITASSTYAGGGLMTTGGNIVIPDAGNIGSASDTDAISIASDGAIVMSGATVTVSGALGVSGETTLSTHLNMGDNDIIKLGAGSDLQLSHNGTNSIIDNNTGSLLIQSDALTLESDSGEDYLTAAVNGAVTLFYDNASKLATVTGGVNVTGTLTATTNVTVSSDIRLKSNIETIDSALDKVKAMRGVYFDRHDDKATRAVGVIAQEMQEIMPEVVVTDDTEDKYLSVAYGNLVGVLIEAVKELSGKIDRLEDR